MTGNIGVINPLLWHTLEHGARALASFEGLTTLMTQTGQSSRHRRNTTPRPLQQEDYKGPLNYREINTESCSYHFDTLTMTLLRKRWPTILHYLIKDTYFLTLFVNIFCEKGEKYKKIFLYQILYHDAEEI